jgi:hypothetical protein
MSRFLRAGIIADKMDDIIEAADLLAKESDSNLKSKSLALDILDMAMSLREFLQRWDCEPLIYTGRGTTDEVINMLDYLLSKVDKVS